ncbi:MAG: PAS domain-containing protein, partial [Alphaproteobacteria bacterium]|nr:PAS domain-containing protein [Alphaproteobacteria bacterium]
MSGQWRHPYRLLAAASAAIVAVAWLALPLPMLAAIAVLLVVAWTVAALVLARNLRRLAGELCAIARGGRVGGIEARGYPLLSPLPEAVSELALRLVQARQELADGLAGATARAEEGTARLAAILNDLHEGVVVCNLRHQVVLYNQTASELLARVGHLGLSRSVFETMEQGPVIHMLTALTNLPESTGQAHPFLAASADGRLLLQARMTLVRDGDGATTGYVVTMIDAGHQIAALGRRDALLRNIAEGLEAPLARLRAAQGDPAVIEQQVAVIERSARRAAEGYRRAQTGWWPMADLSSADLFEFVVNRFDGGKPKVTITGLPVGLYGDSHSLVLTLVSLVGQVASHTGATEIDLTTGSAASGYADDVPPHTHDEMPWLDLIWEGKPIPDPILRRWLKQQLPSLAGMTVRDVLVHHGGDAVSQAQLGGRCWLRLPMRRAVGARPKPRRTLPNRPEFYDMELLARVRDTGGQGSRKLRSLTYVVFDTETTGLRPAAGDQIVQIGAVRIVNGRILSGETFNRLVDPGCAIPQYSTRFHGITEETVRGKPPITAVLPQFKAFVSDAVLVGHNAAFDLKFLRLREQECGVAFDNPLLDTMLLSTYLDGP